MFGIMFIGLVLSLILAYTAQFFANYAIEDFFANIATLLFCASCGYGIYTFYSLIIG